MDLCTNVFEPMKSHIYEPNISLISLISLVFNYTEPQMSDRGYDVATPQTTISLPTLVPSGKILMLIPEINNCTNA